MRAPYRRGLRGRRRASAYVAVLGSAMVVSVIGLSSLILARIHHRTLESASTSMEARLCAQSIVEAVVGSTVTSPTWRTSWGAGSGSLCGPVAVGPAQCYFKLVDEIDGDLSNDPEQPVRITGTAQVGSAIYRYSVVAEPPPLKCLRHAVHAIDSLTVDPGAILVVYDAPAYCQGRDMYTSGVLTNSSAAKILGDTWSQSVVNQGTISGVVMENVPRVEMPTSAAFTYYRGLATAISWAQIVDGTMEKLLLSESSNPYGTPNPDGVYYVDTSGNQLLLRNCRIRGTLLVEGGTSNSLVVDEGVYWEPFRADYPALIVNGSAEIGIDGPLSESACGVNFNPPGTPQNDTSDLDMSDQYPGVIKGLVHVMGSWLILRDSTRIEGAVVCHGTVTVQNAVTVVFDRNLITQPPKMYRAARLNLLRESWRREATP